jgi:hypothetical protein
MIRKPQNNPIRLSLFSLLTTGLILLPLMFLPLKQIIFLSQSDEIRKLDSGSARLEKMVFTAQEFANLNFTRSQSEFIYRGNMYDVHSITRSDNEVEVLVLWDCAETSMLQAFQNQGDSFGASSRGTMHTVFLPYFCIQVFHPVFSASENERTDNQFVILNYKEPAFLIGSPPPELLS